VYTSAQARLDTRCTDFDTFFERKRWEDHYQYIFFLKTTTHVSSSIITLTLNQVKILVNVNVIANVLESQM